MKISQRRVFLLHFNFDCVKTLLAKHKEPDGVQAKGIILKEPASDLWLNIIYER